MRRGVLVDPPSIPQKDRAEGTEAEAIPRRCRPSPSGRTSAEKKRHWRILFPKRREREGMKSGREERKKYTRVKSWYKNGKERKKERK